MSHVNRTIKIEKKDEENIMETFLQHINEKYQVHKDILKASIDTKSIEYKLERYKFNIEEIDDEIEAQIMNNGHEKADINDITSGIKIFLEILEKKSGENANNQTINLNLKTKKHEKNKAVPNILNQQQQSKKIPPKILMKLFQSIQR